MDQTAQQPTQLSNYSDRLPVVSHTINVRSAILDHFIINLQQML